MLLTLDGRGPRYTQITRALIDAIRRGTIAPAAARHPHANWRMTLDAPGIVLLAYGQLILEGFFVSHPRGGTFVAPDLPQRFAEAWRRAVPDSSAGSGHTLGWGRGRQRVPCQRPVVTSRPARSISSADSASPTRACWPIQTRAVAAARNRAFSYGDPAGDPALRREIATRLRSARGISRSPDQIVLTSGTQQALDICARVLLGSGIRAVMEDPGYDWRTRFLRRRKHDRPWARGPGRTGSRVPADRSLASGTGLRHASHQFPTGA